MKKTITGLFIILLGALTFGAVKMYVIGPKTVSTTEEILELYYQSRNSLPPIPGSYQDVMDQLAEGRFDFISDDWAYTHNGGTYYLSDDSKYSKEWNLPMRLLAYEDLASGKVVLAGTPVETEKLQTLAVVDAPEFAEFNEKVSVENYLMEELWPRRIIWSATLKAETDAWADVATVESMSSAAATPMMMTMSLPSTPTNLVLAINSTNSNSVVEIEISYPATFTNRVEVFASTNLVEGKWEVVSLPIVTTGSSSVVWYDTQTNLPFRSYRAGNADLDTDLDGLLDAREVLLYGTDRLSSDTDQDFMDDAWELQYSLNPNDDLDMILDPDHDMLPNVYEYHYGLNPNSNDSSSVTKLRVDPANAAQSNTYSSIQAAFNASTDYSIIEIAEGTYSGTTNTTIFFPEHPVMLMSDNWGTSKMTVVEYNGGYYGGGSPAAFILDEMQDNRTIIRGLTLNMGGDMEYQIGFWVGDGAISAADGSAPYFDGVTVELGMSDINVGYFCRDASQERMIFNNCIIRGKRGVEYSQRGIYAIDSSPIGIYNCSFQDFTPEPYSYGIQFESTFGNYGNANNPVDVEIANTVWDESFAASNAECFVRLENGVVYDVHVENSIMPKTPSWFPPDSQSNLYITNAVLSMGAHQTTNSPGIDKGGTSLTWYDFEGQLRSGTPDIGADEFAGFGSGDSDSDGVSDLVEATVYLSDIYRSDSDGDSISDGDEVSAGTNPTNQNNYSITILGSALNQTGTNVPLYACTSHTEGFWNTANSTNVDSAGIFIFSNHEVDSEELWVEVFPDFNSNGINDSNEPIYAHLVAPTGSTYQCNFLIRDYDGDGVADWDEIQCGTDFYDPVNFCLSVNGTVSNSTPFDGALGISISSDSAGSSSLVSTNISTNGTFSIEHLEVNAPNGLWIHLFNDMNTNVQFDAGELSVSQALTVTDAVMSVEIELSPETNDNDSDDMIDFWEQVNGLSWTNSVDAHEDPDGDWINNKWEHDLGLDPSAYNTNNYAFADAMQAVDSKLVGISPTNSTYIYNEDCYSTTNFVRNTNCWASAYDLTCISPWNSYDDPGQWDNRHRAGTLVTPRHVIFATHFDQIPTNQVLRFIDQDNNIIERTLVSKKRHPDYYRYYPDLTIGLLDSDVPTNAISYAKVLPDNFPDYIGTAKGIPALCLDQEEKALIADLREISDSGSSRKTTLFSYPSISSRAGYSEPLIGGDSGNPSFFILNQELVLLTVWTGGFAGSGTSVTDFKSDINQLISDVNQLYGATNNYQLTETDLSGFDSLEN